MIARHGWMAEADRLRADGVFAGRPGRGEGKTRMRELEALCADGERDQARVETALCRRWLAENPPAGGWRPTPLPPARKKPPVAPEAPTDPGVPPFLTARLAARGVSHLDQASRILAAAVADGMTGALSPAASARLCGRLDSWMNDWRARRGRDVPPICGEELLGLVAGPARKRRA